MGVKERVKVEYLVGFIVKAFEKKSPVKERRKIWIKNQFNRFDALIQLTTNHSDRTVIDLDSTLGRKAEKSCKEFDAEIRWYFRGKGETMNTTEGKKENRKRFLCFFSLLLLLVFVEAEARRSSA